MTAPVPVQANADERELAAKIARMVRAGHVDEAADTLATQLQRAYDNGFADGYHDGSLVIEDAP